MAKVKIQGHASGTGVLTVTAPNTSTDRTITLPDSTDTLAVNSDVTNKLPLAGGTMTGNLVVGGSAAPRVSITSSNANGSSAVNFLSTTNNSKNWEVGSNLHNSDGLEFTPSTANGNSTFTTPTVSFPVAGGITFGSDTAAANALDDYEEGTFTATLSSASAPSSPPTATGNYTKVGNWVHFVIFRFHNVDTSGGSGAMKITGLPFTVGTSSITTNFATHNMSFNSSYRQWCEINTGTTTISFLESRDGNSWLDWSITAGTGKYLSIAGSYKV